MRGIPVTELGSIKVYFRTEIAMAFKELLVAKHLYQSLRITPYALPPSPAPVYEPTEPMLSVEITEDMVTEANEAYSKMRWDLHETGRSNGTPAISTGLVNSTRSVPDLNILLPDIKIYCQNCRSIEAHNLLSKEELLSSRVHYGDDWSNQLFVLYYECQACKGAPAVFLIQRQGLRIRLTGRVPMEKVLVPNFLPKDQCDYFSDALIAYNSGQFLPAVFMLRTFIEQYLRSNSKTPETQNTDSLFDEYADKLPKAFKDRFPSLNKIYQDLSIIVHLGDRSAKAEEVFLKAQKDIIDHFDAKRVWKI